MLGVGKEFVINLPPASLAKEVDFVGIYTGAKMDKFDMIMMHHRAENWEILSSRSLVKNLNEYIQLMVKDEDLAVGTIMETAAQMRRFTQGIREMEEYLSYNKDILMCESENDIFMLYYELAVTAHRTKNDVEPVREKISKIMEFIKKLNIYDHNGNRLQLHPKPQVPQHQSRRVPSVQK